MPKGYGISFWGGKNVLKLVGGGVCTIEDDKNYRKCALNGWIVPHMNSISGKLSQGEQQEFPGIQADAPGFHSSSTL